MKATGDIIEISEDCSYLYAEHYDKSYNLNELEFLDVKEKSFPKDTPDYWTLLEHQAAIAAMQGIITDANNILCEKLANNEDAQNTNKIAKEHKRIVAGICVSYATALIEKLQEEK